MKTQIHNIDDLRAEILRLRTLHTEHENDLEAEAKKLTSIFRIPAMLLNKFNNWFGGFEKDEPDGKDGHDWITNVFKIGLPVMMNKFFFPRSGFMMRSIIQLFSQKAAKSFNRDVLGDFVEKITDWIKSSKPKSRKITQNPDYGIPPDSETY